jgi:hypothetical protein
LNTGFLCEKVAVLRTQWKGHLYYLAGLRILARAVLAMFLVNGTESSQDTNLIMRTAMRDN